MSTPAATTRPKTSCDPNKEEEEATKNIPTYSQFEQKEKKKKEQKRRGGWEPGCVIRPKSYFLWVALESGVLDGTGYPPPQDGNGAKNNGISRGHEARKIGQDGTGHAFGTALYMTGGREQLATIARNLFLFFSFHIYVF